MGTRYVPSLYCIYTKKPEEDKKDVFPFRELVFQKVKEKQ